MNKIKISPEKRAKIEKIHKEYCDENILLELKSRLVSETNTNNKQFLEEFILRFYYSSVLGTNQEMIEVIEWYESKVDSLTQSFKNYLKYFYKESYKKFSDKPDILIGVDDENKRVNNILENYYIDSWTPKVFTHSLDIKVCPYCNEIFINTMNVVKESNDNWKIPKGTIRPTLDHFYSQKSYPILSMALYNLVPSCNLCNSSIKNQTDFIKGYALNPYENNIGENIKFKLKTTKDFFSVLTGNSSEYSIDYDVKYNESYEEMVSSIYMVEFFYLPERYQAHKEFLSNQFKKQIIYSNNYVAELAKLYGIDFAIDNYEIEEDLNKKILGKLFNDINSEIINLDFEDNEILLESIKIAINKLESEDVCILKEFIDKL